MTNYILTENFLHKLIFHPSGKHYVESTKLHSNAERIAAAVLYMMAEDAAETLLKP